MPVPAQLDRGRQLLLGFCVLGSACIGLVAGLSGYRAAPAAGQVGAAGATVVSVTAGKPSEFAFTLSKSSGLPFQAKAPSGTVSFRVANRGLLSHDFKVCTTPVTTARRNTCKGTGTRLLEPGESATLTVTFEQRGTYEYLSSAPGQAAEGMKGLIGIGVSPGAATPTTTTRPATTAPAATTTTTYTPTAPQNGAVAAGAAVWAANGCNDCHSVSEVETQSGGNINLSLNTTHSGGPFPKGPLNATQMQQLAAFINS